MTNVESRSELHDDKDLRILHLILHDDDDDSFDGWVNAVIKYVDVDVGVNKEL